MHRIKSVIRRAGSVTTLAVVAASLFWLALPSLAGAASGDVIWEQRWNAETPGWAYIPRVAVSATGNVFVAMTFDSDLQVLCYAPDGTLRWTRSYKGPAGGNEWSIDVRADRSGNVVVLGSSAAANGEADWIVRKYTAAGKLRWSRRLDGTRHKADEPRGLTIDKEGAVIVTGKLQNTGTASTWYTVKYTASGAKAWAKTLRGAGVAVAVDPYRSVYVTGNEWRDSYSVAKSVRFSPTGRVVWTRTLRNGDSTGGQDIAVNTKHVAVAGDSGSRGIIIRYTRAGALMKPTLLSPAVSDFWHVGIDDKSRVAAGGGSYWNEGRDPTLCLSWKTKPFIVVPTGAVDGGAGDLAMTRGGAVALVGYVSREVTGYDAVAVFVAPDGSGWVQEYSGGGVADVDERGIGVAVTSGAVYVAMDAEHELGGVSDLVLVKYDR